MTTIFYYSIFISWTRIMTSNRLSGTLQIIASLYVRHPCSYCMLNLLILSFPLLLCTGGDVPVTNRNREEYVLLYVQYILDLSIAPQFEAFQKGEQRMLSSPLSCLPFCSVVHYTTLHCIALFNSILHCTVPYHTIPYQTSPHSPTLP